MPYDVEIGSPFRAQQGLSSPARSAAGLPSLDEADGRPFVLRAGLTFADEDVDNSAGRAVDSDVLSIVLQKTTRHLSAEPWTSLFNFRPSLERVARHLYDVLTDEVGELGYVEIADIKAGLVVRYRP